MSLIEEMANALRAHQAICDQATLLVEADDSANRPPAAGTAADRVGPRQDLLARLRQSVDDLRRFRILWQRLSPSERSQHPEMVRLIRGLQDAIMKVILLERENEQALLRQGLVPPRHLPPPERQRPHFVSELYRRRGATPGE